MVANLPSVPYGKRLVSTTVDEIAEATPERVFACIPRTNDLKDGFRDVTFGDFARGVNRTAWWLENLLGKSTTSATLAYIGPSDLRYHILLLAASKAGYQLFLPSPRNSLEGQLNLFSKTSCDILISTPASTIQEYLNHRPLQVFYIPELSDLIAPGDVPRYPYSKTFEEAKRDPWLILHTSGSTGLPKPVFGTNSNWCSVDNLHNLPLCNGYEVSYALLKEKRVFSCLPPFHCAGLTGAFISVIFWGSVSIWPPADRPMSSPLVEEMLDAIDIDIIFCSPSILEDLSQTPRSLKKLSKLQGALYGGGPLSHHAGGIIREHITLANLLGTTESVFMPFHQGSPENWEYFHVDPSLKGIELRPYTNDLYEMFLVRHPSTDPYHGNFTTFPHLTEYSMSDLYAKHPTDPHYWIYVGRSDDVIVLSNAEKVNPIAMEAALRGHAGVKGSLIVGQGKFSTAAIVELTTEFSPTITTPEARAQFIDSLWPYAVIANEEAPAHAQLSIDRLIIASSDKPFLRAGKGTVQRAATVKLFESEIEELYQRSEESAFSGVPQLDLNQDSNFVEKDLEDLFQKVTNIQLGSAGKDFFSAGIDSLHVMQFARHLKSALGESGIQSDEINTRIIYTNPTLESLTSTLRALRPQSSLSVNGERNSESREEKMLAMLKKYVAELPHTSALKEPRPNKPQYRVIILTGSTGSLGSYILDALVTAPGVEKVYCLNRKPNAESFQKKSNSDRGLISEWGSKVIFLQADLSRPNLGLVGETYEQLAHEVTTIIHNQWQVDFNLSLPSFESHVAGVANLIKLSSASSHEPSIFFTSSIGTLSNWNEKHLNELVPETALEDPSVPGYQGYSESKWISERLLELAAEKSGVSSAICRVGQIAGPVERGVKGIWNPQEWLPSIIASSKYLGLLPESIGSMDEVAWTPVDKLSQLLVELVLQDPETYTSLATYYHLDNPKYAKWSSLLLTIQEYLKAFESQNKPVNELKIVTLSDWVKALRDSGKSENMDMTKNPGLKLLDFYQGLNESTDLAVKLDTAQTRRASEKMRGLKAVDEEWMRLWLEQWRF